MNKVTQSIVIFSLTSSLRYSILLFTAIFFLASCKTQKKIANDNSKCFLDYKNSKTLTSNLKSNEFNFEKLNAKINVESTIDSSVNSFSISLRIKKDSLIWMSISKLGIEGARVLITKDSVKFTTRIPGQTNKYFKGNYTYISKLLNTDLDYEMLQSLLIGKSVEFYNEDEKIKAGIDKCRYTLGTIRKNKLRKVVEKGKELKEPAQIIYLDPITYKISKILFYEFNPDRSFEAHFTEYKTIDSTHLFPMQMDYIIKAQKNIIINLKYSKILLNEDQSFPFKIPNDYEQIFYNEKK
jgi:hypothetical protein